jgi:hypothetical protein
MILMNQLKMTKSTYKNSIAHTTLGSKISLNPKLEANKLKSRSEAQWKSSSHDGSKGSNRLIQAQVLFKQDGSFLGNTYSVSVYRK